MKKTYWLGLLLSGGLVFAGQSVATEAGVTEPKTQPEQIAEPVLTPHQKNVVDLYQQLGIKDSFEREIQTFKTKTNKGTGNEEKDDFLAWLSDQAIDLMPKETEIRSQFVESFSELTPEQLEKARVFFKTEVGVKLADPLGENNRKIVSSLLGEDGEITPIFVENLKLVAQRFVLFAVAMDSGKTKDVAIQAALLDTKAEPLSPLQQKQKDLFMSMGGDRLKDVLQKTAQAVSPQVPAFGKMFGLNEKEIGILSAGVQSVPDLILAQDVEQLGIFWLDQLLTEKELDESLVFFNSPEGVAYLQAYKVYGQKLADPVLAKLPSFFDRSVKKLEDEKNKSEAKNTPAKQKSAKNKKTKGKGSPTQADSKKKIKK
jgi:hypothetical protein